MRSIKTVLLDPLLLLENKTAFPSEVTAVWRQKAQALPASPHAECSAAAALQTLSPSSPLKLWEGSDAELP